MRTTDTSPQTLGAGLKVARLSTKPPLTQKAVADEVGVAQSTVARAEAGEIESLSTLLAIAAVLGRELRLVRNPTKRRSRRLAR